jgi:hypothetical protein
MSDKDMDLKITISGTADKAVAMLKTLNEQIKSSSEKMAHYGATASATFSFLGKATSVFLKPVEYAAKATGLLGGVLLAAGGAALKAAADDEVLIERLAMAGFGAAGAAKEFEKLEKISRNSQFPVADLAQATMYLKQFGLESDKNLAIVANAAKFTGGSMEDLAIQIGALQARGLKRFGISMENDNGAFILSWKDRFGQLQKLTTTNAQDAQRKLLDVMGGKFGSTIKSPTTLKGSIEALKNGVEQIFSNVGGPMLAAATRFVNWIREGLDKLFGSGALEGAGKKLGEWIDKGHAAIKTLVETLGPIWDNLQKLWSSDEGKAKIGDMVKTAILGVGKGLAGILFGALYASFAIWRVIGKLLSEIFVDSMMDQLSATKFGAWLGIQATDETVKQRRGRQGQEMNSALQEAGATLETAMYMMGDPFKAVGKELNSKFLSATGMNVGKALSTGYASNLGGIQSNVSQKGAAFDELQYREGVGSPVPGLSQADALRNIKMGTSGKIRVVPQPTYEYTNWCVAGNAIENPALVPAGM